MDATTFWIILSFSFLMALTGAMSPGPLFTYTIIKSIQTKKRGWLIGFWVIVGHAMLEIVIIFAILAGFSMIIASDLAIRIIGIVGGLLLLFLGGTLLRDLYKNRIPVDFLKEKEENSPIQQEKKIQDNPIFGGILVSMSNPYWWAWWATIGLAVMIKFEINFTNGLPLLIFFIGHELGDLLWYFLVSTMAFLGRRTFNKKIYYGILSLCGLFMIGFGIYLGISPFI